MIDADVKTIDISMNTPLSSVKTIKAIQSLTKINPTTRNSVVGLIIPLDSYLLADSYSVSIVCCYLKFLFSNKYLV